MHAPLTPPKPKPSAPYYLIPNKGGPAKEYADQWQAAIDGYLTYGMANFRVKTEAEFLTEP